MGNSSARRSWWAPRRPLEPATPKGAARPPPTQLHLIVQAQQIGVADPRYRDDVHGAVLLIADFRDFRVAAQGRNDTRHGVAVPDDQHSSARVLAQRPAREALGVVGRRDGGADA